MFGILYWLGILGVIGGLVFGLAVIFGAIPGVVSYLALLYPVAWLRWKLGWGSDPRSWRFALDVIGDEEPKVDADNLTWKVNLKERVSACDNRPGLKMIYVTVLDEKGKPLRGVKVRFATESSEGIAYDHMNIWGLTDVRGYLEWEHLGKPTRYVLWMGDEEDPLIENIRTDFGNEYCKPLGSPWWSGNISVNRPGIYSYRIEVQKKGIGEGPAFRPPVVSNLQVEILDDDLREGYARAVVTFDTDVVAEARAYYSLAFEGGVPGEEGEEMQFGCDPFSVGGWRSAISCPGLAHVVELWGGSLWYSAEAKKKYCLQVVAWLPEYRYWGPGKGYSEVVLFTLPHGG